MLRHQTETQKHEQQAKQRLNMWKKVKTKKNGYGFLDMCIHRVCVHIPVVRVHTLRVCVRMQEECVHIHTHKPKPSKT